MAEAGRELIGRIFLYPFREAFECVECALAIYDHDSTTYGKEDGIVAFCYAYGITFRSSLRPTSNSALEIMSCCTTHLKHLIALS